jgi:DNA polymerase III delta subunit
MIHIFHGEHADLSRKELYTLKEKWAGKEIIVLDGKMASINELTQATESTSLFGGERLTVIENLLTKRMGKKSGEQEVLSSWIKALPKEVELVFWEEKEIGKTILNIFPKNTDTALFKPDRNVFAFVESLRPDNQKNMLSIFSVAQAQDSAEMLFAMLTRQVRLMLIAKDGGKLELSPWQARKISQQADAFTLPQLFSIYQKLFEIDGTIKSGTTAFNLSQLMEVLLCSI